MLSHVVSRVVAIRPENRFCDTLIVGHAFLLVKLGGVTALFPNWTLWIPAPYPAMGTYRRGRGGRGVGIWIPGPYRGTG